MITEVVKISNDAQMKSAREIRYTVFVEEQKVPEEDEYDEWEETSHHYLALTDGKASGTARWRFTANGIKLERFAVLSDYRNKGVGSALVEKVLAEIATFPEAEGKKRYLHGQIGATPLYKKFNFEAKGEPFDECGIQHYLMELKP